MKTNSFLGKKMKLVGLALALAPSLGWSQINYQSDGSVYQQDFNTLPTANFSWTDNQTIAGWYATSSASAGFTSVASTQTWRGRAFHIDIAFSCLILRFPCADVNH